MPSAEGPRAEYLEDHIQDSLHALWILGDEVWADQRPVYVYEHDEPNFQPYLAQYVVEFVDDILIYSASEEEHERHFRAETWAKELG